MAASTASAMADAEAERERQRTEGAAKRVETVLQLVECWRQMQPTLRVLPEEGIEGHDCARGMCELVQLEVCGYTGQRRCIHGGGEAEWVSEEWEHVCISVVDECAGHRSESSAVSEIQAKWLCDAPHLHNPELMLHTHNVRVRRAWSERDVYVCANTGSVHWCGGMCQYSERLDPHTYVTTCPVTGNTNARRTVLEARMRVDDYSWQERQALYRRTFSHPNSQSNIGIRTWCHRIMNCRTIPEIDRFIVGYSRASHYAKPKKLYHMIAVAYIWMLLCRESMRAFEAARADLRKTASAFLEGRLDSHRHHTMRARASGQPPPLLILADVECQYSIIQQKQWHPEPERGVGTVSFMLEFATIVMVVWQVVHKHAPTFGIPLSLGGFRTFVIPCLYMLRDGFSVHGQPVFSPHAALRRLPDHARLRILESRHPHLSRRPQDDIETAIRGAIVTHMVDPHHFSIVGLEYSCLSPQFFPLRGPRHARRESRSSALVSRVSGSAPPSSAGSR